MSLDVFLIQSNAAPDTRTGIFVRENGQNREISWEEWRKNNPDREPVIVQTTDYVFERNITHNLGAMAAAAGLYTCVWRPDENGITKAHQLIEPLRTGLTQLTDNPTRYEPFNPVNGWGDYDGLVAFVTAYLQACETYPDADISVSR